jgi:hypothetical protein
MECKIKLYMSYVSNATSFIWLNAGNLNLQALHLIFNFAIQSWLMHNLFQIFGTYIKY